MADPQQNVPREPSDTQEWIRERFGAPSSPRQRPQGVSPEAWAAYQDLKDDDRIARQGRRERARARRMDR
jgi:hypothetical protein